MNFENIIKTTKKTVMILSISLTLYACPQEVEEPTTYEYSDDEESLKEYLKDNRTVLNIEDNDYFDDLNILLPDLEGKSIFFTAEIHGNSANDKLRMKFLKFLKHHTNFKYYLEELPFSTAYYINMFLDSGDTTILDKAFKPFKGAYFWNKSLYNHWIDLYDFNNRLKPEDKIKVIGVDLELSSTGYLYMYDIIPQEQAPEKILDTINLIKSELYNFDSSSYSYEEIKTLSENIKNDVEANTEVYKEYLGEDFLGFNHVNNNVLYLLEALESRKTSSNGWNNTRDYYIYENFKIIEETLPEGKFYGQWGMQHTFQKEFDGVTWFASYLNKADSKYNNRILTIAYSYDSCIQMNKNNGQYFESNLHVVLPFISDITADVTEKVNLFKLNDLESRPNYQMMSFNKFQPIDYDVSQFFQYAVVIKGFGATEPLNKE